MDRMGRGKLLVVEDEAVLRRLISDFLRGEGFEVIEAADGSQGVALYEGHGPFDLVLLDLNLPVLSGIDVCRQIKAERPLQPVLICSAAILDWHLHALHELRVDQFLTKPYHPLELLDRIGREIARPSPRPGEGSDPETAAHIPGARRPSPAAERPIRGLFSPRHVD